MWEQNIKEESRLGCFEFFKRELCLNDTYIKDEEMINQELAKIDPINESDVEIKTVKERSLKDSRLLIIDPVNDITYVMASQRNIGRLV